jgi:hypothetical protein
VWLDIVTIGNSKYPGFSSGLDKQLSTVNLTFNFTISIGSGYGRTVGQFQTCAKP